MGRELLLKQNVRHSKRDSKSAVYCAAKKKRNPSDIGENPMGSSRVVCCVILCQIPSLLLKVHSNVQFLTFAMYESYPHFARNQSPPGRILCYSWTGANLPCGFAGFPIPSSGDWPHLLLHSRRQKRRLDPFLHSPPCTFPLKN
jgi:hypothetical protein